MQNQYNLVYREEEREMLPLCRAEGIGYTPYSPLARGFLARRGDSARLQHDPHSQSMYSEPEVGEIQKRTHEVAKRLETTPAKVALAWLLRQPGLTAPVIGATKLSHVQEAVGALEVTLSDADASYLEELYRPRSVLLHL
jgi:aryl-alcohol dehydrogenase (NADP+)